MPITADNKKAGPHYKQSWNTAHWVCRTKTPAEADTAAVIKEIFAKGHDWIVEIKPSAVCGINMPSPQGRGGEPIAANPGDMVAYPSISDDLASIIRSHNKRMLRTHYSDRVDPETINDIGLSAPPTR